MTNAEDRNVDATRTRMADPLVMGALPRTKVWIHPTHPLSSLPTSPRAPPPTFPVCGA